MAAERTTGRARQRVSSSVNVASRSGSSAAEAESPWEATRRALLKEREEPPGVLAATYTKKIEGSPEEVMQAWLDVVWDQGGMQSVVLGPQLAPVKMVYAGDGNRVGATRAIFAVKEQILSVDPGKEILYTCFSGFPASYHRGIVVFEDQGDGTTLVSWTMRAKPYLLLGWLARGLAYFGLNTSLKSLEASQAASQMSAS